MNNEFNCPQFEMYDEKTQQSILLYLNQLNTLEIKAYHIARDHLGSSFNIVKSNGYISWKNKKN